MMGRALTRAGRSPATLDSTRYRSVWLSWVASAPLRAPRHRGHGFGCVFPTPTNPGLLGKRVNDTERRPLASPFRESSPVGSFSLSCLAWGAPADAAWRKILPRSRETIFTSGCFLNQAVLVS